MKRFLLVVFAIVSVTAGFAQEAKYKALYTYNFTKQIEWPAADKSGNFVICVIGNSEVYNQLRDLTNLKKVGTQAIEVLKLKSIEELPKCHILFLASSESSAAKMEEVTSKLQGTSTLILTERSGSLEKGSCINFKVIDGKIKFEVNKEATSERKLQISTQLLNMAL